MRRPAHVCGCTLAARGPVPFVRRANSQRPYDNAYRYPDSWYPFSSDYPYSHFRSQAPTCTPQRTARPARADGRSAGLPCAVIAAVRTHSALATTPWARLRSPSRDSQYPYCDSQYPYCDSQHPFPRLAVRLSRSFTIISDYRLDQTIGIPLYLPLSSGPHADCARPDGSTPERVLWAVPPDLPLAPDRMRTAHGRTEARRREYSGQYRRICR